MSKLGFALVGLDHWYAAFGLADAIGRSERARLIAVAHHDAGRAEQVARERGAALATTEYQAAIERPDVDVVVAMCSSDQHVAVCRAAAAAGKQIIGVKPIALDLAGADAIVAAVRAAGVHYLPFESTYRLTPVWGQIKAWLDAGRIGRLLRFSHALHGVLPQAWPQSAEHGWWLDPARVPGGAWIDHAIYGLDLARWLFASEPHAASGLIAKLRHRELPLEDYGAASFAMADDGVVLIEDSWTAEPGFWFHRNELIGSAGAIVDETNMGGELRVRGRADGAQWAVAAPAALSGELVEHMIDCVGGVCAPVAGVEDARANLAACLAFYRAARSGEPVPLGGAGAAAHP